MDAVEYEKGRRRMCRTNILKKGSCEGCDAYSVLMRRCDFAVSAAESEDENIIRKNIALVEQWVKDNPVKTRKSEMQKIFPDVRIASGAIYLCPSYFLPKEARDEYCKKHETCEECRKDYWLTEVTDND